ncbi:unnamed protein product [Notodromas monacha]|uniref:Protein YIF1 n=1 Tax=Notodromas monacha TaxID=399045 RepID=A0A7R9BTB2_9CRUS|nr:unnamed protein product [Notodromas monacha]CAG0921366.1 unnamed protein product [Notodromas monacha]
MYPGSESRKRASGSFPPGTFDPAYADQAPYAAPHPQQYDNTYYNDWNASQAYRMPAPGIYPTLDPSRDANVWQHPNPSAFPGGVADFLQNPMVAGVASQYGRNLVGEHLDKYRDKLSSLKYYFAVDTTCVAKKLGLLLFPFAHDNWTIQYRDAEPVQPRHDVNVPDLYIPLMAFVTYICVAGYVLGAKEKFEPEQLGIYASSALIWLVAEVLLLKLVIYLTQMPSRLTSYDLIAYCGYKYVGMIVTTLCGHFLGATGYYSALAYTGVALAFLVSRALRVQIMPQVDEHMGGNKRRFYFLCATAFAQPLLMWWRTSHLL